MALIRRFRTGELYDGIRVLASPGTHEAAAKLIEGAVAPDERVSATVLEMGAGNGAFSRRLRDIGFEDITAWDIDAESVKAPVSCVEEVDLNGDIEAAASGRRFDLIVALEVIEHLENPWAFFRGCSEILAPGGVLLISTPNIESAASRIDFLRNGRFVWFHDKDLKESGHIAPLGRWQVKLAASRAGLASIGASSNSEDAVVVWSYGAKGALKHLLALVMAPVMKGSTRGEISLYAFRAPERG